MYSSEEEARDWLAFLTGRQPHKRIELTHRRQQLNNSTKSRRIAMARLAQLAEQYPQDYLVFKTQQRLLGK